MSSEETAIMIVGALVLVVVVLAAVHDAKEWDQYRETHHCHVTGHREGSVGIGTSSNGETVTTVEGDQDVWVCDGGEIIIR